MAFDALRRRVRYHTWAMATLADALADADAPRALRPFAHALAADQIWLRRLRGEPTDGVAVWPELSADGCRQRAADDAADLTALFDALDDAALTRTVSYRTTRGVAHENTVADVLEHLLLHAAHHRGQVNVALRAAGAAPPHVDFIAWLRAGEPS